MNAIRQYEFGPAENLRFEVFADPQPAEGQVAIAVEAAGVHVIDLSIRRGIQMGPFPLPALPMTPGREVAGTVDALGPGVDERWLRRRVVGHLGQAGGGYAERAVAPVEALHELGDGVGAEQAVAMIGTGRTAMAILEAGAITAQDTVLVTAAAGGIGTLLLQAALAAGAGVVGVAGGPEKVAHVRALGATVAVDYREAGWEGAVTAALDGRGVSLAFDGVGGAVGRGALTLLAPTGRLVVFGFSSGEPTALTTADVLGGRTVTGSLGARITQRPGGIRDLERQALAALADGTLTPALQRFPLADAAAAHTALAARATTGKVVLLP
ncbi:MAG: NADPH:quinone reductase [Baekduia sp.]|nr:NADPH:quinone reductase [Baekduia sp.]